VQQGVEESLSRAEVAAIQVYRISEAYENEAEMNTVIGNLADNTFIKEQKNVLKHLETI
jgi:hypothetical protein